MKLTPQRPPFRHLWIALLTPFVLLSSQNCSSAKDFHTNETTNASASGGNGDGYSGVIVTYDHNDPSNPCADFNAQHQPLANDVIFANGSVYTQVRALCRDIAPRVLDNTQIAILPGGHLHYANIDYVTHTPVTFETIAESCPAGRTLLANPVRQNMFVNPLDLTGSAWGAIANGMTVTREGAIADLVSSRVARLADDTTSDEIRTDQYLMLGANQTYAVSFLAKPGSSKTLRLEMYISGNVTTDSVFAWDLTTGALTQNTPQALLNVSSTSRAFESGYLVTLFFTLPSGINALDIGVASGDLGAGQYIYVSEAQFEQVNRYCGP